MGKDISEFWWSLHLQADSHLRTLVRKSGSGAPSRTLWARLWGVCEGGDVPTFGLSQRSMRSCTSDATEHLWTAVLESTTFRCSTCTLKENFHFVLLFYFDSTDSISYQLLFQSRFCIKEYTSYQKKLCILGAPCCMSINHQQFHQREPPPPKKKNN